MKNVLRNVAGWGMSAVAVMSLGKAAQLGLTSHPTSDIALWMINGGVWLLIVLAWVAWVEE